jgi:DNA-binding beta-propeller fold protein YncE
MDRSFSRSRRSSRWVLALVLVAASAMRIAPVHAQQLCGGQTYPFPYTDVSGVGPAFCPGIMEAYVIGVTKGTSPTTFSPNESVPRLQMTTFLQRSLDQGLARASRRAALRRWWVPRNAASMQTIALGGVPYFCEADGENIWTSTWTGNDVVQVQASTGTVLGTWTGASGSTGVVVAAGKVFVAGQDAPGKLYVIDPTQPPSAVTVAASNLGNFPAGIAFDGTNLWTTNEDGSVSVITPQATTPYPVTTITSGFIAPNGILYDGAHIWVTNTMAGGAGTLLKLDPSNGTILQTVAVGANPAFPVFDGTNIWVPNFDDSSITVVQASTGKVVATIAPDGINLLAGPAQASFDGDRILVTNVGGPSVTLFKAADLSFIANVPTGPSTQPSAVCSDGVNFWLTDIVGGNLLRF